MKPFPPRGPAPFVETSRHLAEAVAQIARRGPTPEELKQWPERWPEYLAKKKAPPGGVS